MCTWVLLELEINFYINLLRHRALSLRQHGSLVLVTL